MRTTTLLKNHLAEFVQNDRGDHYLKVLCGGAALFEAMVKLAPEELSLIKEYGEYYIEKLAVDISDNPESFRNRTVAETV